MKFGAISFKDLSDTMINPTVCMSANRGCKSCQDCKKFIDYHKKNNDKTPKEIIDEMPCNPQVGDIETLNTIFKKEAHILRIKDEISKIKTEHESRISTIKSEVEGLKKK